MPSLPSQIVELPVSLTFPGGILYANNAIAETLHSDGR
jgi:hypothetical protein